LLVERSDAAVTQELIKLIEDRRVDEVGVNPSTVHALWTLNGLGAIAKAMQAANDYGPVAKAVSDACEHPAPSVRINAVYALPRNFPGLLSALSSVRDKRVPVQVAALLTFADMPLQEPWTANELLYILNEPERLKDKNIEDAVITA